MDRGNSVDIIRKSQYVTKDNAQSKDSDLVRFLHSRKHQDLKNISVYEHIILLIFKLLNNYIHHDACFPLIAIFTLWPYLYVIQAFCNIFF